MRQIQEIFREKVISDKFSELKSKSIVFDERRMGWKE
jgi:hypothetical protein